MIKLLTNLYAQKQAGRVWNQYQVDKHPDTCFIQSLIDDCVFYQGSIIVTVCVDDDIFLGCSNEQLTCMIQKQKLEEIGLCIANQWHLADYIVANINELCDRSYVFSQVALIEAIPKGLGMPSPHEIKRNVCAGKIMYIPSIPWSNDWRYSYWHTCSRSDWILLQSEDV